MKSEMRTKNVKMAVARIRSLKTTHDRPWRKAKVHKVGIGQGRRTAWRLVEIILGLTSSLHFPDAFVERNVLALSPYIVVPSNSWRFASRCFGKRLGTCDCDWTP